MLVDGFVRGVWRLDRQDGRACVRVEPLSRWSAADRHAVAEEAGRLLAFAAPGARHDVEFAKG